MRLLRGGARLSQKLALNSATPSVQPSEGGSFVTGARQESRTRRLAFRQNQKNMLIYLLEHYVKYGFKLINVACL